MSPRVPGCKAGVVTEFSLRGRGGPDRGSDTGTRYHKSRRNRDSCEPGPDKCIKVTASRLGLAV